MTEPLLISFKDAMKYLSVSENTLRWYIRTRQVPFLRIGQRRIFFDPVELEAWKNKRRIPMVENYGYK
jgi:hypothetical protein